MGAGRAGLKSDDMAIKKVSQLNGLGVLLAEKPDVVESFLCTECGELPDREVDVEDNIILEDEHIFRRVSLDELV